MRISASILNADLANLEKELLRVEASGADMLHLDVMDGVFTESITFGDYVIKKLRPRSRLLFDTHLMVKDPTKLIPLFAKAGADMLTIHVESDCDVAACLKLIRSLGLRVGLSLNPGTPVEKLFPYLPLCDLILIMSVEPGAGGQPFLVSSCDKIKAVRIEADRQKVLLDVSVDGGINLETAELVRKAGASVLVTGTFLLRADDMANSVRQLKMDN
ncbi:MAG: ribulose-phosphate 3-epimerase [Oscillospiraceae bacterium]|nr:ribulose-phosphate 3-epimerase [Oscillospiraceae bacterium]